MAVLNFQMSALFEMLRQLCHFTCCMCIHYEKMNRFLRVAYRKQLDNWKKTDKERRRGQQLQAEVHVQKDQQRSGRLAEIRETMQQRSGRPPETMQFTDNKHCHKVQYSTPDTMYLYRQINMSTISMHSW